MKAVPYDGRHTFVSLLINEGITPMLVAQRTGHSLDELWKTYAHLFESADELNRVPMGDALSAARATIAARSVHGEFTGADSEPSPTAPQNAENPLG